MSTTINQLSNQLIKEKILCTHCDEEVVVPYYSAIDKKHQNTFCCLGCVTVYEVIHDKGLDQYYEIKKDSEALKRRSPAEEKAKSYSYLDEENFQKDYSYTIKETRVLEFYLEGIHCLACLWLIEKLPEFIPGVSFARLDIGKSIATIGITTEGQFSKVAKELHSLGYKPHPLKRNEDQKKFQIKEERTFLKRMAVAAAASMNIMLYAVSIYAGADGIYAEIFGILTVVLAIPVMTYSAYPFYLSAFNALKNKKMNLDVPIAMALLIGFFYGIFNITKMNHENYLDSLTALVFLLLITRYFLLKVQQMGLTANDLNFFYTSNSILKQKTNGDFEEIHPTHVRAGDFIKVKPNEMIPVDGIIKEGNSYLNLSLLNGESLPRKAYVGEHVFSGTENIDQDLIIEVTATDKETRLGKILKGVENGWANRAQIVQLTDSVSSYFISAVFVLSLAVFIYQTTLGNFGHGLNLAITLLIVTCPCALALATPMTLTNSMSKASKKGIIIKNDQVIQKLSEIKTVFIDKTGTITFGKFKIIYKKSTDPVRENEFQDIIFTLEKNSRHPIALALKEDLRTSSRKMLEMDDVQEVLGTGVQGYLNQNKYVVKAIKDQSFTTSESHVQKATVLTSKIGLYENDQLVYEIHLQDQIRPDSKMIIQGLKKSGFKVLLLSGDKKEIVQAMAREVGLTDSEWIAEISPEEKCEYIKKDPDCLMIGDGANDALALSYAKVGVAVQGAMDISLRASDVYLTTPGIKPLFDLLTISRETMYVIYRNLVLSLSYNTVSVFAVFLGFISPLVAAIIMPVSSLTVLLSTIIGTKKLRMIFSSEKSVSSYNGETTWK